MKSSFYIQVNSDDTIDTILLVGKNISFIRHVRHDIMYCKLQKIKCSSSITRPKERAYKPGNKLVGDISWVDINIWKL